MGVGELAKVEFFRLKTWTFQWPWAQCPSCSPVPLADARMSILLVKQHPVTSRREEGSEKPTQPSLGSQSLRDICLDSLGKACRLCIRKPSRQPLLRDQASGPSLVAQSLKPAVHQEPELWKGPL